MMTLAIRRTVITALAAGFAAGLTLGWRIWRPNPATIETAAAAVHQMDGSEVLERRPDPAAKPKQILPKGAKVERVIQVTVQPSAVAIPPTPGANPEVSAALPAATPCPPVTVDLSLIRMPDKTRRVVASSPDGLVVGGLDVPVDTPPEMKDLKWAVGGVYGQRSDGGRTLGVFVDRDFAFLRTGVQVLRERYVYVRTTGIEVQVRVGIRF